MVDVGHKAATERTAAAEGEVHLGAHAWALLAAQANAKGEVFNTARIAGILAAKRCAELIPLCHTLPLSFVGVDFAADESRHVLIIRSMCHTRHETGVEMEAMTACAVAALTVYDMCKAADKGIVLGPIRLMHKTGGKSGDWWRDH